MKFSAGGRKMVPKRCVTPVDLPDLDERIPDMTVIPREIPTVTNVFPSNQESPKIIENFQMEEEEDVGIKMETVEEFIRVKSEQKLNESQAEYPKNILKKVAESESKNYPKIEEGLATSPLEREHRKRVVTLRDPWMIAPKMSVSFKEEEKKGDLDEILNPILTDSTQDIPEKIQISRENGCEMCDDNKEAFTTTITVCMKCRPVLKTKKKGRHIWRWVEGFVIMLLLATIATLSYYVSGKDSNEELDILKEKYELTITALNSTKDYISSQQLQILNLSLTLHACHMSKPIIENKLSLCEESIIQVKEDLIRTTLRTTEVNQIYKEIEKWIVHGLVQSPNPGAGGPIKDLQFTPTNLMIIKSYINDITIQLISSQRNNINKIKDIIVQNYKMESENNLNVAQLEQNYANLILGCEESRKFNKNIQLDSEQKYSYIYSKFFELLQKFSEVSTMPNRNSNKDQVFYYENKFSQWRKNTILLKTSELERKRQMFYNLIKNMDLRSENIILKKNHDLLSETYRTLKSNCTTFQSNSADILWNLEMNSINIKKQLLLNQPSYELFYSKEWYRSQLLASLEFYTITYEDGIYLWGYDKEAEVYNPTQIIAFEQSGHPRRGRMNQKGIYIVAGWGSSNVKIYDMKYYKYSNQKIRLLNTFSHSDAVAECLFKNPVSAICCDYGGYIKEYDLTNTESIAISIFNQTVLDQLVSCMQTEDMKYIIAGSLNKFYILNATDGALINFHNYGDNSGEWNTEEIAEIRPNIIVTTNRNASFIHNLRDIMNIPAPILLSPDLGDYYTVTALMSNLGDFALGGRVSNSELGFVYILHLGEDNQTITTLKYIDDIPEMPCQILVIKELKKGSILFGGGYYCTNICLWNYAVQSQDLFCWKDNTESSINDIEAVPDYSQMHPL